MSCHTFICSLLFLGFGKYKCAPLRSTQTGAWGVCYYFHFMRKSSQKIITAFLVSINIIIWNLCVCLCERQPTGDLTWGAHGCEGSDCRKHGLTQLCKVDLWSYIGCQGSILFMVVLYFSCKLQSCRFVFLCGCIAYAQKFMLMLICKV